MGLDVLAKRYFPVLVCALIALAAYFQASGMGQLVAGSIAGAGGEVVVAKPTHHAAPAGPTRDPSAGAAAILARNPFDSVTGALDGSSAPIELPAPPPPPQNTDPLKDPVCEGTKVLLISASDDPTWSFASVAGNDGKSTLRRQGDDVGGQTVQFISWDRIWLSNGGTRCQVCVGEPQSCVEGVATMAAKVPAPTAPTTPAPTSTGKGSGKKVPAEIAAKITKVSETEFSVERSVVDQILENQSELMKSARIVPEKQGDKVVGIRLFGIRPDSLLGTLGLQNGDRLQTINGFDMGSPEKALEAYARLRTADHLTVTVNRRGKDTNIDFSIK